MTAVPAKHFPTPPPRRSGAGSGVGAQALALALLLCALSLGVLLVGAPARAQDLRPVPPLSARVIDQTDTLDAAQLEALQNRLAAFEAESGPQIVVLIVPTTQPEDIAAYAQRVGDRWKIGRRDVGDGLLLLVAKEDRRLWIAPAKSLEGAVPDLAARQIARDLISPAFKTGDFATGLDRGLSALMARIRGEGLPEPSRPAQGAQRGEPGSPFEDLLVFLFVAVPVAGGLLARVMGRKLAAGLTAAGTWAVVAWVTQSLWLGLVAALVALVVVGILGVGSAVRALGGKRWGRGGPVVFGEDAGWGGGWSRGGGTGGFGGFSSGGGGDFGGGGAGGDW